MIYLNIEVTWQGNVSDEFAEVIISNCYKDYLFELLQNSSCTKINIEQGNVEQGNIE